MKNSENEFKPLSVTRLKKSILAQWISEGKLEN